MIRKRTKLIQMTIVIFIQNKKIRKKMMILVIDEEMRENI